MYSIGIIGMPNAGKTTLFNALAKAHAPQESYPFCTIDPNIGVVEIPDDRTDILGKITGSKNVVKSTLEFIDIAGLVKGASKGEGLGNQFLSKIREVEVVIHTVRCFYNENALPYSGEIDPVESVKIVNLELILSDLAIIEKRLKEEENKTKSGGKEALMNIEILKRLKSELDKDVLLRNVKTDDRDKHLIKEIGLLSNKPTIYLANINLEKKDSMGEKNWREGLKKLAVNENAEYLEIDAEVESEIAHLSKEEQEEYYKEMGVEEKGLEKIIMVSKSMLNLISFLTTMPNETKSWVARNGISAVEAAAMIHSDMARGFIKAEVINYDDLIKAGSMHLAKEKGKMKIEGREYIVKEGDVIHFKFNV